MEIMVFREKKNTQNGVDSDKRLSNSCPSRGHVFFTDLSSLAGSVDDSSRQCGAALTRMLIKINGARQDRTRRAHGDDTDASDTYVTPPITKEISSENLGQPR